MALKIIQTGGLTGFKGCVMHQGTTGSTHFFTPTDQQHRQSMFNDLSYSIAIKFPEIKIDLQIIEENSKI